MDGLTVFSLVMGVLLCSEPTWGDPAKRAANEGGSVFIGVSAAAFLEATLSGFASIHFEKVFSVAKSDC